LSNSSWDAAACSLSSSNPILDPSSALRVILPLPSRWQHSMSDSWRVEPISWPKKPSERRASASSWPKTNTRSLARTPSGTLSGLEGKTFPTGSLMNML